MLGIEELPQEVKEEIPVIDTDVKQFLVNNITGPKNSKLKIINLWGNAYRLNFWGKKIINPVKGEDDAIVYSVFIIVKKTNTGCEVIYQVNN